MKELTYKDAEKIPKSILTPKDIAPFLKTDPHCIRVQAREDPSKLGFNVSVVKSRIKIPKEGFVKFLRGERDGLQANI